MTPRRVQSLLAATKSLLTIASVYAVVAPAHASTRVYLNFSGGTFVAPAQGEVEFAARGTSDLVARLQRSDLTLAPLQPPDGVDRAIIQTLVVAELEKQWRGYEIEFVTQEPIDDRYTEVVVGEVGQVVGLERALGWSASDCNNENPNNLAFVFSDAIAQAQSEVDSSYLAVVISQELAHTLGLDHIDGPQDAIMRPVPVKSAGYRFLSTCSPVFAGSQGGPVVNVCNVHPACPAGQQNDDEALAAVLGRTPTDDSTSTDTTSNTGETSTTSDTSTGTISGSDGDAGCSAVPAAGRLVWLVLCAGVFARRSCRGLGSASTSTSRKHGKHQ